jgi:hypothetical protein
MHLSPILPTWPHEMYGTIKSNSSLHSHTHAHLLKTHHKPHYATHLPSQRWLTFLYFVSFMLRHWRAIANMPSCFRCCLVLCMAAFYDCAASLRLTRKNLCAMSMVQFLPREQIQDNLHFGECKRAVAGLYYGICVLEWWIMWELCCIAQLFLSSCTYDTKSLHKGAQTLWEGRDWHLSTSIENLFKLEESKLDFNQNSQYVLMLAD